VLFILLTVLGGSGLVIYLGDVDHRPERSVGPAEPAVRMVNARNRIGPGRPEAGETDAYAPVRRPEHRWRDRMHTMVIRMVIPTIRPLRSESDQIEAAVILTRQYPSRSPVSD
jgi:hypothetical protein